MYQQEVLTKVHRIHFEAAPADVSDNTVGLAQANIEFGVVLD